MKPIQLVLRCYADKKDGQWQAFCIDLCLAAQGDTLEEVKAKLDSQIRSYVEDAVVGEDKEFASQLLSRKAPLRFRLKYYYYAFLRRIHHLPEGARTLFDETLPLHPNPV